MKYQPGRYLLTTQFLIDVPDSFAENGRKLFVTMHIINVTKEDDSHSDKGSYECHAYAVNHNTVKKYGFSVNVVEGKTLSKRAPVRKYSFAMRAY